MTPNEKARQVANEIAEFAEAIGLRHVGARITSPSVGNTDVIIVTLGREGEDVCWQDAFYADGTETVEMRLERALAVGKQLAAQIKRNVVTVH